MVEPGGPTATLIVLELEAAAGPTRELAAVPPWITGISIRACRDANTLHALAARASSPTAVVLDGRHPDTDRDLVTHLVARGLPVIVIAGIEHHEWLSLGATATFPSDVPVEEIVLAVLDVAARRELGGRDPVASTAPVSTNADIAPLVAVTGSPDLAARLAVELSDGLTQVHPHPGDVVLVDATRHGRLHAAPGAKRDQIGLADLAAGHRWRDLDTEEIAAALTPMGGGGARLVTGLRTPDDWLLLRPAAVAAAFEAMRAATDLMIVLVDDDLDGERNTGSIGIEDRNLLARMLIAAADVIVITAAPPPWGRRDADLLRRRLREAQADAARGSGRTPHLVRSMAEVMTFEADERGAAWDLDPGSVAATLGSVSSRSAIVAPAPIPIAPGELGGWDDGR